MSKTIAQQVLELYHRINRLLSQHQFKDVDQLLVNLDLNQPKEILVGMLRITYPAKHRLPHWFSTLERIENELQQRGEPTNLLLRGLKRSE